jgi:hypothetical protein
MFKIKLRLLLIATTLILPLLFNLQGCAVVAVTGAVAGAVVVTTVKVGSAVVGTAVDVTRAVVP